MRGRRRKPEFIVMQRLYICATTIDDEIGRKLRERFAFTRPRFDLLALLDRSEDGISLSEASKRLMVTAPNITPMVQRLAADGYVVRATAKDRRKQIVRITRAGRSTFRNMSRAYAKWINQLFADLPSGEVDNLNHTLGRLEKAVKGRCSPLQK
jgi:DNA-binding MarR family transcriptional regulator